MKFGSRDIKFFSVTKIDTAAILGEKGLSTDISFSLYDDLSSIGVKKGNKDRQSYGTIQQIVSDLRKATNDREQRFEEYKKAIKDPIIGQAIEMMADDATQFDVDRQRTIWVTGDKKDRKYVDALNWQIQSYIEPFIDTIASAVTAMGEFVFKVDIPQQGEGEILETGFKNVPLTPIKKIAKVHHVVLPDQSHYYVVVDKKLDPKKDYSKTFKEWYEFVHYINVSLENSREVMLKVQADSVNSKDSKELSVFILEGESILTEKVLETWRILRALEDAIIATRMSKSKLVRFVKVNVTRLTDDNKAQNLVNYIHSAIVENERISTDSYESTALQAEPVVVTIPVKDGTGDINIDEFESNADIKDIADIDHFLNKLFAGLRIPKSYFDWGEAMPAPPSGASLTKSDIRYSRGVKKIQRVLVKGTEQMIRVFNHFNNIDEKKAPEVNVHIVKVSSAEDEERYIEMQERMNTADQVINSFYIPSMDITGIDMKRVELLKEFFTAVIPFDELRQYFEQILKKTAIVNKPEGVEIKKE